MAIASSDKLVVVKAFAPSNPLPLDAREIHESLADARAYAATSPIAYAGQDIKVVENGTVTVYTLVPSNVEGENYTLQFVGGGGSGIQNVGTSANAGNISISVAEGDTTVTKDVPVVGAFVDVAVTADTEEKSEKTEFTYKDASNAEQKKAVYATGIRKVEAGSTADKVKVTNADTTGALTSTEILIGAGSVKNPTYDADTRKITLPILQADGTTQALEIALGKDMVVTSGAYNAESQEIELTLTDGSVVKIPAANLVDVYTGDATATVTVTVSDDNVITAALKVSAVEGNLLKVGEDGLYVSEADFTATKQLITDAESAAKSHADDKVAAEATARATAISEAIAQEVTDRNGAIATAKEQANQYTDGKVAQEVTDRDAAITAAKEAVNKYTDDQIAASEAQTAQILSDAVEDLNDAINTAKANYQSYANEKIAEAIDQEVKDRDAAIAVAKGEAESYADDQVGVLEGKMNTALEGIAQNLEDLSNDCSDSFVQAKKYADDQVAAEATARDAAIATAKGEANTYADGKASAAEAAAKAYMDEQLADKSGELEDAISDAIDAEVEARDAAIATAKGEAVAYTDSELAKEVAARDAAIATAKGEANTYTDGQIAEAKTYADGKASAAQSAAEAAAKSYTDGQIAAEVEARDAAIAKAVAEVDHLKREIVDAVPSVEEADTNTIYMVTITDGAGNQKYEEFMVINGAVEKIGDSAVDLTNYATKDEVATAKGEANAYTDGQIAEAKTYAEGKASAAQAAAEATAKSYTDGQIAEAKTYADGKASAAQAAAEGTAKGYTDGQIAAEVEARNSAIATAKGEANTYADGKASAAQAAAEATAKSYTDGQIAAEVTARDAAIATAKGEAVAYTDEKVAAEVTARDTAIATAKGEAIADANSHSDANDATTLAAAKEYTDQVAAQLGVKWIDFGA